MDLKQTYNKIAKDWAEDHQDDVWWIGGANKFSSFLKPKSSILDVGCGFGLKSKYLTGEGFDVTGIDFSEEMIKLAKQQVSDGKFFIKDIKEPLGFNTQFDGIFAQAILIHIPKKEVANVLENITAPLKSGGFFYAAVKKIRPGGKEEEIVVENDYGYNYKRFFSYFTLDELKKYVEEAGLRVIYKNIVFSNKTNWIQIIAKK